ncbi:MAG: hypothetical protein K6A96_08760 [Prevotella sp.]|nr:hypothetical protein [Prevotella sp.]
MMNNELKIRTLVERFFDGETTLGEEHELYNYFSQKPAALPEDLRPLREMFLGFDAVQSVAVVQQQTGQRERRWTTWAAAAVAALLIGGAATLSILKAQADEEYVAYIYGERVTDREVVLSEMHKTMAAISNDGSDIVEEQLKSMFAN